MSGFSPSAHAVRLWAARTSGKHSETAALVQGLREKAEEFRKGGSEIYRPAS